jgi:serine/threonine protein kinase
MSSAHERRPDGPGSRTAAPEIPDDPVLLQAVQEYLGELEAGRRPSRQDFLRRYPAVAEPLARCLDGLDLVHHAAGRDRPPPAPAPAEAPPAKTLGDFQIVREIGRGGMGIVYEAVQLSLDRPVALKVLPFAATFDAKHLQRFRNEAHAAAQLHHTNIVPVYAVGAERGVNFYAMQLIEGQSLAVVIRQLRQEAGRPTPEDDEGRRTARPPGSQATASLPPPEPAAHAVRAGPPPAVGTETIARLSPVVTTQRSAKHREGFRTAARLMLQAAEALEYAHQMGIVHRDIKPANLLVDARGVLWITDFGLAQFRADAGLTQTGDVLGTLRYMSPEQASGQRVLLDHRTDVYSLGATLYELVTLEPIFPGQNYQRLLHQILHDEPRAPRAVEKAVPVELETIILKAVSKGPADRYATAQQMADDLRRYLEDKPILARRPSLLERGRKWSRRHPSVVIAGVVLLLFVIAGLFVNNRMIAREQHKTANALDKERERAAEAEKRFQQARKAVDALVDVCEEELADLPPMPQVQGARKRLLEMAVNVYQDLIEQRRGDPSVRAELAAGEARVRRLLDELSALQGADQLRLVTEPDVQADLGLTTTQRDEVDSARRRWFQQMGEHFHKQRRWTTRERRQRFAALVKGQEKELDAMLDPWQRRRLAQVSLQVKGSLAFQEPDVVSALRLTAKQQEKIHEIQDRAFGWGKHGGRPKGADKATGPRKFEDVVRATVAEMVSVLTAQQARRWQVLTGEPFRGHINMFFGRPPGPFGPPRSHHGQPPASHPGRPPELPPGPRPDRPPDAPPGPGSPE